MQIQKASVTVTMPASEVIAAIKSSLESKFAALGKLTAADTADADLTVVLTFSQPLTPVQPDGGTT